MHLGPAGSLAVGSPAHWLCPYAALCRLSRLEAAIRNLDSKPNHLSAVTPRTQGSALWQVLNNIS